MTKKVQLQTSNKKGKMLYGFMIYAPTASGFFLFPVNEGGEYVIYPTIEEMEDRVEELVATGEWKGGELEGAAVYEGPKGRIHMKAILHGEVTDRAAA